jgi:ubiquinone/menaquinone biosynthesis C-methylase UbiE
MFACDLTLNMLRHAQSRDTAPDAQLNCIGGNGRMLPFADDQFDAVIAIRFLHLFPAALIRPFIEEMWRVLRPGGVLLLQFDSALSGGGLVWLRESYRRFVRHHKPRYLIWPGQIEQLLEGIAPATVHGFSPFGGRFVRQIDAGAATWLNRSLAQGHQSFLANHVFVRVIKSFAP